MDFKEVKHHALPLARIKKIMKSDEAVKVWPVAFLCFGVSCSDCAMLPTDDQCRSACAVRQSL
jgi:hypothetical protein